MREGPLLAYAHGGDCFGVVHETAGSRASAVRHGEGPLWEYADDLGDTYGAVYFAPEGEDVFAAIPPCAWMQL